MAQPTHGPRVQLVLSKLLPPGLVAAVAEGPPEMVLRALGQVGEQRAALSCQSHARPGTGALLAHVSRSLQLSAAVSTLGNYTLDRVMSGQLQQQGRLMFECIAKWQCHVYVAFCWLVGLEA